MMAAVNVEIKGMEHGGGRKLIRSLADFEVSLYVLLLSIAPCRIILQKKIRFDSFFGFFCLHIQFVPCIRM
jgi:hypothetical protein